MARRNYYEVPGVEKNASTDEVKRAYRRRAIQLHPDKNPGNKQVEENSKEATETHDMLNDPQKRQRYDQSGHAGVGGVSQSGGFDGDTSMEGIFSQFGDIFGGHFGGSGGSGGFGGSHGRHRMNRGSDLRVRVRLNLEEIVNGAEKKIKVREYVPCSHCYGSRVEGSEGMKMYDTCRGSGVATRIANTTLRQMQTQTTCPTCGGEGKIAVKKCMKCNGEGVVRDDEVIAINIPAGVAEGMQLSVNGKGNVARHNGISGDLLTLIEEELHPGLIRDENDLLYNLPLSVPQAALGATVEVPTIDGKAKLKIEPGTQSGKVLRLCNRGLPPINSHGMGDLLMNVSVYIPETSSSTERKTLDGLENSPNFQPNRIMKEKILSKFKHFFD